MDEERRKQFDADLASPAPVSAQRSSHAAVAAAVGGDVIAAPRRR